MSYSGDIFKLDGAAGAADAGAVRDDEEVDEDDGETVSGVPQRKTNTEAIVVSIRLRTAELAFMRCFLAGGGPATTAAADVFVDADDDVEVEEGTIDCVDEVVASPSTLLSSEPLVIGSADDDDDEDDSNDAGADVVDDDANEWRDDNRAA